MRLTLATLHEMLSRNTYSLHGLVALIRSVALQVCQRWMVSSNWTPGSAHFQADSAISRHSSRARNVSCTWPVVRRVVCHGPSCSPASMERCGTRTELFEFCPDTVP